MSMNWGTVAVGSFGSAAATIVAVVSGAMFTHPHGPFRPQPEVCPPAITCVIVAGLDGDVHFGPNAGGEAFGFDLEDEVAGRLVGWLEDGGQLRVYKLPEQIDMPERGVPGYERAAQTTMERARAIGERFNARLVVIGRVNTGSVSLTFVDPNQDSAALSLTEYELPSIGVPSNFHSNFRSALAAARANRPAETPISSTEPPALPGGANAAGGASLPPDAFVQTPPRNDPASFPTTPAGPPQTSTQAVVVPASIRTHPTAEELTRAYPERALERGVSGEAAVLCYVGLDGRLHTCEVTRESPAGMGFGRAAERLARRNTLATPQTVNGAAVENGPIEVPYEFKMLPD